MAYLFSTITQKHHPSSVFQKRKCFQIDIRKNTKQQKMQQLRDLNMISSNKQMPDLINLVGSLPYSIQDIFQFVSVYTQYSKLISKLILEAIYFTQLKAQFPDQIYRLCHKQFPAKNQQLKKQCYLFNILLSHQGIYSQQLLKRYFDILLDRCVKQGQVGLMFQSINIIVSNTDLNWVPLEEIHILIKIVENYEQQIISVQELKTYFYLSNAYFKYIQQSQIVKNRIKKLLQNSSKIFYQVSSKIFLKLCINLTYFEENKACEESDKLTLHQFLIKGEIYKIIFRNIFFGDNTKIKILCLELLRNLICQLGSDCIWRQQKLNPVENFEMEIKNKNNDFRTFQLFCEVFLISILMIPTQELLQNSVKGEINTIELLEYILQNCNGLNDLYASISELSSLCFQRYLTQLESNMAISIAKQLKQNKWQKLLGENNQILDLADKILQ